MDKFIYIGMTGAKQALDKQNSISQNLANASTPGYKAAYHDYESVPVFGDVFDSRVNSVLVNNGSKMTAGELKETGNPMDMAILGGAWFEVELPGGNTALTKAGNFKRDQEGNLTTAEGLPVMGQGGQINIPEFKNIYISEEGNISVQLLGVDDNQHVEVGKIKMVTTDAANLLPLSGQLFKAKNDSEVRLVEPEDKAFLAVGFIESSNVNSVEQLVGMLAGARGYEMNLKMMAIAKELDQSSSELISS